MGCCMHSYVILLPDYVSMRTQMKQCGRISNYSSSGWPRRIYPVFCMISKAPMICLLILKVQSLVVQFISRSSTENWRWANGREFIYVNFEIALQNVRLSSAFFH